jgi:hypothetical protein
MKLLEIPLAIDDEGNRKFIFPKNSWVDFMNIENGLVIFINYLIANPFIKIKSIHDVQHLRTCRIFFDFRSSQDFIFVIFMIVEWYLSSCLR